MEAQSGEKIRVVLRWIQILDDKESILQGPGEFAFNARVHSENIEGVLQETRYPATGHLEISDEPGHNRIRLDLPVFEGYVQDHLAIEFTGTEFDRIGANDELNPYKRVFKGPPAEWIGSYGPGDEQVEPEDLGDWRIWYRIEKA